VILPTRVAILCPEGRNCGFAGYAVSCFNKTFNALLSIHFTHVQALLLVEKNITCLVKDSFVSLTEKLDLSGIGCGLRTIELGAYNGLTELAILLLKNNEIHELLPFTFENLKSLQILSLQYNNLQHLDSEVFSGLLNLNYIDLEGNHLQYLHPDTFLGLPKL
jgi:hypothetical protein